MIVKLLQRINDVQLFQKVRSAGNADYCFLLSVEQAVCCAIPPSNLFKPNITLVFINHGYLPQHIIL